MSFLMIPLTFLCDECIDRPKLSEQKNPFEYIVPPPTSEVGTISRGRWKFLESVRTMEFKVIWKIENIAMEKTRKHIDHLDV